MNKIATHNSATGESGYGFLSWLTTPFAKTQSKTLKEQYEAGARQFDIRVKYTSKRGWVCAHGPWQTKRDAYDIMQELNAFPERVQVSLTYEGGNENNYLFQAFVEYCKSNLSHIIYGGIAVKYGDNTHPNTICYLYLAPAELSFEYSFSNFIHLDGSTWQTYLPIPWLWNLLFTRKHEFNEEFFIYVDFL